MSNRVSLPYGTTIEVRDTCLCLHLQRAARAVARRFDELMRPAGLTSGQFSLLMSLNRPEPPTMRAVAELLAMDRTTLTANLRPSKLFSGNQYFALPGVRGNGIASRTFDSPVT